MLFVAAGCALFTGSGETPLHLDFSQTLPADWKAIGTWQQVNIDDDDAIENLLLFTYDQGQVGGAIYDSQITPDLVGVVDVSTTSVPTPTVELVPVPLQPLGSYRPYRLLPSSWSYSYGGNIGHGFLALPKDSGRTHVMQVAEASADDTEEQTEDPVSDVEFSLQPHSELLIRGGDTHLTFVWWRGPVYGYGVTQLTAEGGFRGVDWEQWVVEPFPVEQISGLYPLTDYRARSLLCREILYTRNMTTTTDVVETPDVPVVEFSEQDQGIKFCREPAPAHPFYPEGVVMAYLSLAAESDMSDPEQEQALSNLLVPSVDAKSIESEAALSQLSQEIVNDIAAYATVSAAPSSVLSGDFLPTTTVCVEAAQREDPDRRRWVLFTLRYQPPDLAARLPDRWIISGATEMPTPATQPGTNYCESILSQSPR